MIVEIRALARRDLIDVASWCVEYHPARHSRFVRDFRKALDVLRRFPRAGRKRTEIAEALRSYVIHPYVSLCRVDDERSVITLIRIVHGRIDLDPNEDDV